MSTTTKKHVLIVDDDARLRSLLAQFLQANDFLVTEACDTTEAREALEMFIFDLIVLDIMLPNESGIEFAKKLRAIPSSMAILMLTAMEDAKSRILGLKAGADDYLPKPFEPQELLLRMNKLIDRARSVRTEFEKYISFGNVKYDIQKQLLLKHDKIIKLTDQEKKLLSILLSSAEEVINREELASKLLVNARSIDVQIKRLRGKIENSPDKPVFLHTVRGKGYILYSDEDA